MQNEKMYFDLLIKYTKGLVNMLNIELSLEVYFGTIDKQYNVEINYPYNMKGKDNIIDSSRYSKEEHIFKNKVLFCQYNQKFDVACCYFMFDENDKQKKLDDRYFVLLRLDSNKINKLSIKHEWATAPGDWSPTPQLETLLTYALQELLIDFGNRMYEKNRSEQYLIELYDVSIAIQHAGERFISDIIPSSLPPYGIGKSERKNLMLYSDLDMISFQKYESATINGNLIIMDEYSIDNTNLIIKFEKDISIKDYKMMRKLLEISNETLFLIGTSNNMKGFVKKEELIGKELCLGFLQFLYVHFNGISNWHIYKGLGEEILICCKSHKYQYFKPRYSRSSLNEVLIKNYSGKNFDNILDIVAYAIDQHHGTMIVVSDSAADEAERLKDTCIKITPLEFTETHSEENQLKDIYSGLTSIDGALLCDPTGTCYAIGVILDGIHENGNGEEIRFGARHNSAKRYFRNRHGKQICVIIIVSEDGDVTIVADNGEGKANPSK